MIGGLEMDVVSVILFLLAVGLLRFTTVEENTAKAVMRFGGFRKIIFASKQYVLDEEWNVFEGTIPWYKRIFGGLRFVGIRWIDKIYRYGFRWRDVELVEGADKEMFHEKTIDYIRLRPDTYFTKTEKAETRPPERFDITVGFLVILRVVNPYNALFAGPTNWFENVMARITASFTSTIGTKTYDELIAIKEGGSRSKIWTVFKDKALFEEIREKWGIEVMSNGIQIRSITPPPEIQEAGAAERQLELSAKGRAADTTGSFIEMLARMRSKSVEELREEYENDPEKAAAIAKDFLERNMAIEGGSFLDIRVQGADDVQKLILNALGALKRMPQGNKGGGGQFSGTQQESGEKKQGRKRKNKGSKLDLPDWLSPEEKANAQTWLGALEGEEEEEQ